MEALGDTKLRPGVTNKMKSMKTFNKSESHFVLLVLFCFALLFNTGFLCVALAVLELRTGTVDQVGLELTEICLPLPPECWD